MLPFDFLRRSTVFFPSNAAIIHARGSVTYRELLERVLKLASFLVTLDPMPQTRVAIGAQNSVDHIIGILAVLASGKTWIPINPRNGDAEINRGLEITEPSIILFDSGMAKRIKSAAPYQLVLGEEDLNSAIGRASRIAPLDYDIRPDAKHIQAIKFTGGTSGTPKGAMQSYRSWITMIANQLNAFRFDQSDRFLITTPVTHGASTYLLPILASGGAIVLPDETQPHGILDAVKRYRITTMFMPPTQLTAVVDCAAQNESDTSSLRHVVYGAAPMRPDRIRQAQDVLGPVIASSYGQTEAPQVITVINAEALAYPDNIESVGRPGLLTKVAIKNPDGTFANTNELGEVVVSGDLIMNGYWRQPEITASTIIDGWLHTGDIGFFDERGYLFLRDRAREIIITGGFNVYPSSVEMALSRHAAVAHCAVFGMPDEKWGEAVHAAVELRPGHSFDKEQVLRDLRIELGPVQTPKVLYVMDQLPRSSVGKIMKTEIRARLTQNLKSGEL